MKLSVKRPVLRTTHAFEWHFSVICLILRTTHAFVAVWVSVGEAGGCEGEGSIGVRVAEGDAEGVQTQA